MRKLFLSLGLIVGMVSASSAAIPVPTDKQNAQVSNPNWAGASVCDLNSASGTGDVLCATGKGVMFGVVTTSGTTLGDFVVLRDSATANHTSTVLMVKGESSVLPVSVKFVNGLSATASAQLGVGEHLQILYRLQSDQN